LRIGFHIPLSGGWRKAVDYACLLGCQTMQVFSHNPRSWGGFSEGKNVKLLLHAANIKPLIIHSAYIVNLASLKYGEKSRELLLKEREKGKRWGAEFLVFHPGSGDKKTLYQNLEILSQHFSSPPYLTIENTSGGGRRLGKDLREIEEILCLFPYLRFCLDTAHLFQQGYNLASRRGRRHLFRFLGEKIGEEKLAIVHLNDSLTPLSSHFDRHWHIGRGKIGERGMQEMLREFSRRDIAVIMETPGIGSEMDRINMQKARALCRAPHSTVTDLARFLGLSTSQPLFNAV